MKFRTEVALGRLTLYQFQRSHFCEKARWALDYKGLPYIRKNLVPGLHLKVAKKLAPKSCVPILVDKESAIQDSTSIITYLDEKYPTYPLTPNDPREAKEALDWEEYLDAEIGSSPEAMVLLSRAPRSRSRP